MYERIKDFVFVFLKKMFALTFITLITRQNYNKLPMVNGKKKEKKNVSVM